MAETDNWRLISDGVPWFDESVSPLLRFIGLFSAPTPGERLFDVGDFSGLDFGATAMSTLIAFWCNTCGVGVVVVVVVVLTIGFGSGAHDNERTCSCCSFLKRCVLDCELLLWKCCEAVFLLCLFGWIEPNRVTLWLKALSSNRSSCELDEFPADEISCLLFN